MNLVEEWVIAPSNELVFYTLAEFNEYCAGRVDWLNDRPFSDKDGSRRDAFLDGEAGELLPLPAERFELCEWRRCKVAPDYHVRIDYMHYSVPHALIGRSVDVRVSAGRVTVFDGGDPVAEHARLFGRKGQYSTAAEHMPANHRELDSPWSPERFVSWAAKIGMETEAAIRAVLDRGPWWSRRSSRAATYSGSRGSTGPGTSSAPARGRTSSGPSPAIRGSRTRYWR